MDALHAIYSALFLSVCYGDINIHNPRGSNNRLKEDSRSRENANRLFNSQNNDRGGHNVGVKPLYFYSGSKLQIQWANQHSCGDENSNCEVIVQYMCDDNIRDGASSNTPPTAPRACRNQNCDTDPRFGRHESLNYFKKCAARERNKGLFTKNDEIRQSARSTRQNPAGTRYGYECSEERDYYPYWGPTPWKDIVIFTNNPDRCPYYQQQSQNVRGKFECVFDDEYWELRKRQKIVLYPNKIDCEMSRVTIANKTFSGRWVMRPSHKIPPPECLMSQWSRDNHQGNTIGGEFMKYDWTVPELDDDDENCVLRIRYNISTNDFDSWETNAIHNNEHQPDIIWKRYGMSEKEAKKRQYVFRNNPSLDVFAIHNRTKKFRLRIAINTAQYGRTFQDRTHVFRIVRRPKALRHKVIHNVNVRGKRGNLAQVYPSTEYDFAPNRLRVNAGEMVHFQWTGSDTNPKNNDGSGKAQTDRSNIVQLSGRSFAKGSLPLRRSNISFGTNYPASSFNFLGMEWQKTEDLAFLERCTGADPLLDEKSAYFDLGPQRLETPGTFYYMSTRNNAFSNRDQKAAIYVGHNRFLRRDRGASYRGFKSTTASGRICQRWDRQTPHRHRFNPKRYSKLPVEENFCRNPNRRLMPWCYTTDPEVIWEYCDIPADSGETARRRRAIEEDDAVFPQTDQDIPIQDEL